MESGLQELKFSRYNQKVELSGKLFLYNALTGGYASVDEEYRDNFDKCDFKKLDSMKELAELPNAIINQLMEGGFIIPKNFDEFNVANYAQTECQFRYCGTAIPFLTVRSTAR